MEQDLKARFDKAFFNIVMLPSKHSRDLKRMWTNMANIRTEMSKESVECRRLKKTTVRFAELEAKLAESLDLVEQYLTYATLML